MQDLDARAFHAALVHFPIALLMCSGVVALLRSATARSIEPVVVAAGAVAAVVAAVSGLVAARGEADGDTLVAHRTVALACCALALLALGLAKSRRPRAARAVAVVAAVVVAVAGHYGGALAHPAAVVTTAIADDPLPPDDGLHDVDFATTVQPLLERECFECHGPQRARGGLQLTTRASLLRGGRHGPAVDVAAPASSLLLQRLRADDERRMPPEHALSAAEIELLDRWVAQGAWTRSRSDPATRFAQIDDENRRRGARHWAFQPPKTPAVPATKNTTWAKNEVDAFVLAELEADGHVPRVEASPEVLLRRVVLDLLGRLPNDDDVQAWNADTADGRYERLVDRLLASPEYGVARAPRWLDVARYSDSSGFGGDVPRALYAYRDWVVDALNRDMPWPSFVMQQIAGDIGATSVADRVATGFLRGGPMTIEGGTDPDETHHRILVDNVNTVASATLGVTVGCAECHDHKYDPISQHDFYRLVALFNDGPNETRSKGVDTFDASPRVVLNPDVERRSRAATAAHEALKARCGDGCGDELERSEAAMRDLDSNVEFSLVAQFTALRPTHIAVRGDFRAQGPVVTGGLPAAFGALPATARPDRAALARWLVSQENPLFARVTVNRWWEARFGRGLVETTEDFGVRGARPEHAALLDWLATELFRRGGSAKALDRLMVTSATYRQSSGADAAGVGGGAVVSSDADPHNVRLGRAPRVALDAEVVRDAILIAGGVLDGERGGAPSDVGSLRSSLYLYVSRGAPRGDLAAFDAPERNVSCTRRSRSVSPLQTLVALNGPDFVAGARGVAAAAIAAADDDNGRIAFLYRRLFVRSPAASELAAVKRFVREQRPGADDATLWFLVVQGLMATDEAAVRL